MRNHQCCLYAMLALVVCGLLAFPSVSYSVSVGDVPESSQYSLVYSLDIPNNGNFRDGTSVPYTVNNSASIGLYDRIAYHLELDTGSGSEFVYVSMDAFDTNASRIGLPHNILNPVARQQLVTNMNVFSNSTNVTTGTGLAGGSIEMWPSNYGPATTGYVGSGSGATFDFNDSGFNTGSGFGSFQVHNTAAAETLIAYNRWGDGAGPDNLGIGNQPTGNPDWTFANNAGTYTVKSLEVLVREIDAPALTAALPDAPANIVADAPEARPFKVVYELPIGTGAFNPGQYVQDNSALIPDGSYDRIGYYLELEDGNGNREFVWVSMDAFNIDASLIGIPDTAEAIQQMIVNNMNVVSNSANVTDVEGVEGNIEFWNTNYGSNPTDLIPGGASTFDFDDIRSLGGTYGSFQIHNFNLAETLIAYNSWNGGTTDLGIGNQPINHPDWTFAQNANSYTVRNLFVLVNPIVPEPATAGLVLLGGAALLRRRRRAA